jgi:hypothetical protein
VLPRTATICQDHFKQGAFAFEQGTSCQADERSAAINHDVILWDEFFGKYCVLRNYTGG